MRPNMTGDDPFYRMLARDGDEQSGAADGDEGGNEVEVSVEGEGGEKKPAPKDPAPDWRDIQLAKKNKRIRELEASIAAKPKAAPKETETPDEEAIRQDERNKTAQQLALREFNERCNAVAAKGKAEYDDWHTAFRGFGGPDGVAELERDHGFMTAVLETSDPAKVFHDLGLDTGELSKVLSLTPFKMAIELERIAKKKGPRKEISESDDPPGHISGGAKGSGVGNPLKNKNAPMKDYVAAREHELAEKAKSGKNVKTLMPQAFAR